MFANGLVEETSALTSKYGDSAPALGSLGYKQAAQFLRGEISRDEAVRASQQGHRNYAKRQMTWFRREPEVRWIQGFGDSGAVKQEANRMVREFVREK